MGNDVSIIARHIDRVLHTDSELIKKLSNFGIGLEKAESPEGNKNSVYNAHVSEEIFKNPVKYMVKKGIHPGDAGFIEEINPGKNYKKVMLYWKNAMNKDVLTIINFYLQK